MTSPNLKNNEFPLCKIAVGQKFYFKNHKTKKPTIFRMEQITAFQVGYSPIKNLDRYIQVGYNQIAYHSTVCIVY